MRRTPAPIPPGAPGGSGAATVGDNTVPYPFGRPVELLAASCRNATTAVRCRIQLSVPGQGTVVLADVQQGAASESVCWTGPVTVSDVTVVEFVFLGCVAGDALAWSLIFNEVK